MKRYIMGQTLSGSLVAREHESGPWCDAEEALAEIKQARITAQEKAFKEAINRAHSMGLTGDNLAACFTAQDVEEVIAEHEGANGSKTNEAMCPSCYSMCGLETHRHNFRCNKCGINFDGHAIEEMVCGLAKDMQELRETRGDILTQSSLYVTDRLGVAHFIGTVYDGTMDTINKCRKAQGA